MPKNGRPATTKRTPITGERDLYPIPEGAHRLGISEAGTWQLIKEGKLGSVKLGRRRLIPRQAIESFIASLTDDLPAA